MGIDDVEILNSNTNDDDGFDFDRYSGFSWVNTGSDRDLRPYFVFLTSTGTVIMPGSWAQIMGMFLLGNEKFCGHHDSNFEKIPKKAWLGWKVKNDPI